MAATFNPKQKKRFAVIGSPIDHSLSPDIHLPVLGRFFEEVEYNKVEVKKGELASWIKRVRSESIAGFNVTMPHKADIIPFLDRLEGDARVFRSVNTVVNRQGELIGYNTDGEGFRLCLRRSGSPLAGSNLLILGAGGVAHTLAAKAAMEGAASITVLARAPDKAEEVVRETEKAARIMLPARPLESKPARPITKMGCGSLEESADHGKGTDILVNATPLGMAGIKEDFTDLSFLGELPKEALVLDLIYNPRETRLLAAARARGLRVENGMRMLIYQGMLADQLFMEIDLDLENIDQKIEMALEGKVDRK